MKILAVFTGGTIACSVSEEYMRPDGDKKYLLLDTYKRTHKNGDLFDIKQPYCILSEQVKAEHIRILTELIIKSCGDYDGIIVMHGTDTLQYVASAVAYSLGNSVKIPIIFVSSNYPPEDPKANGYANFEAAVELVRSGEAGVFIAYRNPGEDTTLIHLATRALAQAEQNDRIDSVANMYFAAYRNGELKKNPGFCKGGYSKGLGILGLSENSGILVVHSHPGDSFSYCLDNVKAVILRPYHSGTLNTDSEYLKSFCDKARRKNIPVFVADTFGGKEYESAKLYPEYGIISLPRAAFPAVYIKIWIAVSREIEILPFVQDSVAGEFSE